MSIRLHLRAKPWQLRYARSKNAVKILWHENAAERREERIQKCSNDRDMREDAVGVLEEKTFVAEFVEASEL